MASKSFSTNSNAWGWILRSVDTLLIVTCFLYFYSLRFQNSDLPEHYWVATIFCVVLSQLIFTAVGVYSRYRGQNILHDIGLLFLSWVCLGGALTAMTFLTKSGAMYSRVWFGWSWVSALFCMIAIRIVMRHLQLWLKGQGKYRDRIIILGAGHLGKDIAEQLSQDGWAGIDVVAYFDDCSNMAGEHIAGVPVLGNLDNSIDFIRKANNGSLRNRIDSVWIALPLRAEKRISDIYNKLQQTDVSISFVPDIFGFNLLNHSIQNVAHIPVLNLSASPVVGVSAIFKRCEDLLVSIVAIILSAPIMLVSALAIKWDSSGPVLYKQRRFGLDGREVTVYKFRTMKSADSDNEVIAVVGKDGIVRHSSPGDDRVTNVGAFLRKTSIDELPQFFNVLAGSMSVVGPRPHPMKLDGEYRKIVSNYGRRQIVKPGITGWAQINGWRGNTRIDKRVEHDLEYIKNWSVWFDIKIMFKTIFYGLQKNNAH
ncbi:undecaprenyl-phosphate glucose phosphotransferase [Pseudomonadota bacterium]